MKFSDSWVIAEQWSVSLWMQHSFESFGNHFQLIFIANSFQICKFLRPFHKSRNISINSNEVFTINFNFFLPLHTRIHTYVHVCMYVRLILRLKSKVVVPMDKILERLSISYGRWYAAHTQKWKMPSNSFLF